MRTLTTHQPNVYVTEHQNSRIVGAAFAQGCNGRQVPPIKLLDGPAVVYGILRGCGNIIKQCEWVGRDYYHIDNGYFRSHHFDGYYRVSLNGLQAEVDLEESAPSERWEKLKIDVKPWRRDGKHVLVAPISKDMGDFLGIDSRHWTNTVLQEAARWTDRSVLIRPKPAPGDRNPMKSLEDAWCVVTHASNLALDALVEGVPVITLGDSAAYPCSWDWKNIESPFWPEREPLFHALANHQWTLEEFRSGRAWADLAR